MEVQIAKREFKYNGVVLQDPGAQYSLEQCRTFFSNLYPEIVNAAIEGPTNAGNKVVYEFRKAVGTKGAARAVSEIVAKVARTIAREVQPSSPPKSAPATRSFHVQLAEVVAIRGRHMFVDEDASLNAPMLPPSIELPPLP